jgi:hypothetical protein
MYQAQLGAGKWILLCYLLSTGASAQSFFTSDTGTNFSAPSTAKTQPSPVLSPGEYKSQVNTLHQQTINNASTKYQQQYNNNGTNQTLNNYTAPPPPSIPNQQLVNQAPTGVMPAPAAPLAAPGANPDNQLGTGAAPGPAGPPPTAGAANNNAYTGFGGTDSNSAKSPSSSPKTNAGSAGGWNIKY